MKAIIEALLKAQKEMWNAIKDAKNPFYKSTYADLNSVREACIPLLNENGIVVLQPMVTIDGNEYVRTVLLHESGEMIESFTKILCKAQNDPQAYGSGVTYARRYGLQSLVSIGADDDDGNAASKQNKSNATLSEAVKEMNEVTSYEGMIKVWDKYTQFKKETEFATACTNAGRKYPKNK